MLNDLIAFKFITADWIALAVLLVVFILGAILGFGKVLKFFTSGIFGILISIVVCYIFGGLILKLSFVQTLLDKFISALEGKNGFCDFLLTIHIEIIVYYIVLFIIISIIRVIIVGLFKVIAEANNTVVKVINKFFGAILLSAIAIFLTLLVFQIITWVGGETQATLLEKFGDGVLGKLFVNNPLLGLVERFKEISA